MTASAFSISLASARTRAFPVACTATTGTVKATASTPATTAATPEGSHDGNGTWSGGSAGLVAQGGWSAECQVVGTPDYRSSTSADHPDPPFAAERSGGQQGQLGAEVGSAAVCQRVVPGAVRNSGLPDRRVRSTSARPARNSGSGTSQYSARTWCVYRV